MPKPLTLLSREDLRRLPRWARVALAARAVRRVQHLFDVELPDATTRQRELIEQAISLSENAAKECWESDHPLLARLTEATSACERLARALIETSATAAWIALASARAAETARLACKGNRLVVVDQAMRAIEATMESVGVDSMMPGLHRDWQKLVKKLEKEECDKDTPIPPKLFGSL